MQKSKSDHYVFYRNSQVGIILLVVYVDDIIITRDNIQVYLHLSPFFMANFIQWT